MLETWALRFNVKHLFGTHACNSLHQYPHESEFFEPVASQVPLSNFLGNKIIKQNEVLRVMSAVPTTYTIWFCCKSPLRFSSEKGGEH